MGNSYVNNINPMGQSGYDLPTINSYLKGSGNMNNIIKDSNKFKQMNSDTSSISMSSDNLGKGTFSKNHVKLFSGTSLRSNVMNSMENKKRKRYIKNNKFVFVHPGSAAAKKLEMEKALVYIY